MNTVGDRDKFRIIVRFTRDLATLGEPKPEALVYRISRNEQRFRRFARTRAVTVNTVGNRDKFRIIVRVYAILVTEEIVFVGL